MTTRKLMIYVIADALLIVAGGGFAGRFAYGVATTGFTSGLLLDAMVVAVCFVATLIVPPTFSSTLTRLLWRTGDRR